MEKKILACKRGINCLFMMLKHKQTMQRFSSWHYIIINVYIHVHHVVHVLHQYYNELFVCCYTLIYMCLTIITQNVCCLQYVPYVKQPTIINVFCLITMCAVLNGLFSHALVILILLLMYGFLFTWQCNRIFYFICLLIVAVLVILLLLYFV